jgi:branched-chain amino acid transport system ATP-binding protein
VLEAKALEVRYGSAVALSGVDLRMDDHEMVALIGANGAGKTTLVKALAGLLRPSRGTVEATARVVYVPEGRQLFPDLSVEDNLRIGAWRVKDRNPAKIYEYFPRLGERARQRASTLSGGEQQMVAIGRALMAQPDVLAVDELSLGLAPKVVRELVGHLREFREASGMGLLLVEQNARLALEICERAYVLESGRMVLSGPSKQMAKDPAIRRAYFGPQADES